MKSFLPCFLLLFYSTSLSAQVGIGTTTPNSTLDIRGSLSFNYRSVSAGTTQNGADQSSGIPASSDEVRKVIPQIVAGDEEKKNLGINYAELVHELAYTIKELTK